MPATCLYSLLQPHDQISRPVFFLDEDRHVQGCAKSRRDRHLFPPREVRRQADFAVRSLPSNRQLLTFAKQRDFGPEGKAAA